VSQQVSGIDIDDPLNRTGQSNSLLTLFMGVDATAQCHRAPMGFDMDLQAKAGFGHCQG
jgi:hypothetical protein